MKVQPIYNNKLFKKGLEFAADNGALFCATTSLVLSTVARPLAILATPKTDKENKEYAASKSLASSAIGYFLVLIASLPLAKSVGKIDENPSKYLKDETIKALKSKNKLLTKSPKYNFATQLFKLGLGFLVAIPKSIMTCALIPPIMGKLFNNKLSSDETKNLTQNSLSFTGITEKTAKNIGKVIDKTSFQKFTEKFYNTNFEMHIMALTDILSTTAFMTQTAKNKNIKEERKKPLIYNAGISTGLCVSGGYVINKLTKKSTDKFIKNFKMANKNSLKLEKYVEGIKIAKSALIFGSLYYIIIPVISTFLADKFAKQNQQESNR